ncbi:MAG: hypothetical protein WCP79_00110 [Bacillota bacterium]
MKRIIGIVVATVLAVALVAGGTAWYMKSMIHDIFKLNASLKSEGYYTSELEFKMLGCAYWLDHGEYWRAFTALRRIRREMENRDGVVKIPQFANTAGKLEFYKGLQNPETGSFIRDSSYPVSASIGVSANMISFIEELSAEARVPMKLKYPLRFLDEIASPEKLRPFLDDLSLCGWIGSKFKSSYVEIGELRELSENVIRLKLYDFAPGWKDSFLEWCYDNQDPETGFWGARSRSNHRLIDGGNITDSEKMLKVFVDSNGNDKYSRYPLRYVGAMSATALAKLSVPMPDEQEKLHEWILDQERGIRFFTRYLWKRMAATDKERAADLFRRYITLRFERYYVTGEGAFSLYPDSAHADLDGSGEALGMLDNIGALSADKQMLLWGGFGKTAQDIGIRNRMVTETDIVALCKSGVVNSLRVYQKFRPERLLEGIDMICYPKPAIVLDVADLLPRLGAWANTTKQNMGNWVWKESVQHEISAVFPADYTSRPIAVRQGTPLPEINRLLAANGEITIAGFDILQIPRSVVTFRQ